MQASKIAYTAIFILGVVVGIVFGQFVSVNVAQAQTSSIKLQVQDSVWTGSWLALDIFNPNYLGGSADIQLEGGGPMKFITTNFNNLNAPYYSETQDIIDQLGYAAICPSFLSQSLSSASTSEIMEINASAAFHDGSYTSGVGGTADCSGSGNYYVNFYDDDTQQHYYLVYYYNAITNQVEECQTGCDQPYELLPPETSFLAILQPTPYGTTTSSTTVNTKIFYIHDQPQATTTRAEYSIYNGVTNALEYNTFQLVPAGYDIDFILENNVTLATGSKKMVARYVVAGNNQPLMAEKETFFHVIENSYILNSGLENPQSTAEGLTQIDCDTFDVGCQFQKAITFLFIPPQTTLDKFATLWQELATLKPFGYITQVFYQLGNVGTSGTGAYTLPTIPFVDTIFAPFRAGLSIMLWGIFAFVFYRRVKNIEI